MRQVTIYLNEDQLGSLDRMANEDNSSRSEVVRRLIAQALEGTSRDLERDLEAIDASFGAAKDIEYAPRSSSLARLGKPSGLEDA